MTFHCWVFRRWAFHCWVFRSFCPEYPTTKIPNFSVGYSGRWVFPMLGIPYSYHGSESIVKIAEHKLKKVDKVRLLGVTTDDKLSWEPHIQDLVKKLNLTIIMLKRITKFIPKTEYRKLYDALFKSHLSYCISSWGGVLESKLRNVFSAQKRCIRLSFGKQYSFDHAGYYQT